VLACCCNCPEWYQVKEYQFKRDINNRSDCINQMIYQVENDSEHTGLNSSATTARFYRQVLYSTFFVFGYAIPLTFITVLYFLLLRRIGAKGSCTRWLPGGNQVSVKAMRARNRVMRMVTGVIVTFCVCWLPIQVAFLVEALWSRPSW
jgi:hypothetical protein